MRNLLPNPSCQKRNRYLLQPTTTERCLRPTIRPTLQPNPTTERCLRSPIRPTLQPNPTKIYRVLPTTNKDPYLRWQDLRRQNLRRKDLHSIIRKEDLHPNLWR